MLFLIDYDRESGKLRSVTEFQSAQSAEAASARVALELELLSLKKKCEVVVLEADSIESLKLTHNRYFRNVEELSLQSGMQMQDKR
jgi:hypothetical protein